MSNERPISHEFEGESLESVFIGRARTASRCRTVLLIPTVMGVSDLEKKFGPANWSSCWLGAMVGDLFGKEFRRAPARCDVRRR